MKINLPEYKEKYPLLFEPLVLKRGKNTLEYKNRMIVGPMMPVTGADANGLINLEGMDFYVNFAKGGFAGVTWSAPMPPGGAQARALVMSYDLKLKPFIDWHRVERVIHAYNTNISFELCHPGPLLDPTIGQPVAASPFFHKGMQTQVKEMDKDDMERVIEHYINYATCAKLSGCDSLMLHFAHGFLFHSFLSPLMNHRKDEFGGSVENRVRFPRMLIERLREVVGDMIIEVRIDGNDHDPNGVTPEDVAEQIKCMEDLIDMVHITCGHRLDAKTRTVMHPTHFVPPGHNSVESEIIKKCGVKIPVGVIGSIHTAPLAERLLEEGKADYVLVARQAVADPDFVNKIREGREEDIRPCLRCDNCLDKGRRGALTTELTLESMGNYNMQCSVNPFYAQGFQKKIFITKPSSSKKVAVVGGGIAGMQAALSAAENGHQVTLYEKEDTLGGQLFYSDHMWFKQEVKRLRSYMIKQIKDAGVNILLNTEATPEIINENQFDSVIVAIGAKPTMPQIKGIDSPNVLQGLDVFGKEDQLGKKIVFIGGGSVACEMAIHLKSIDQEFDITLLEMGDYLASTMQITERMHTLMYLDDYHITGITNMTCSEITDSVVIAHDSTGNQHEFPADTVIICAGMTALSEEANRFRFTAFDMIKVGDCKEVGDIGSAIDSGYNAGATV